MTAPPPASGLWRFCMTDDTTEAAREYLRAVLMHEDRKPETAVAYERMMFRLHTHLQSQDPFDAPDMWLADGRAVCGALEGYGWSSRLKHLSVIIETLRAVGTRDATGLARRYSDARTAAEDARRQEADGT